MQRGVGASTNGAAAFGASINMQTETLRGRAYGEYDGSAGSFGTYRNAFKAGTGLIGGKAAFDARLSNISTNGYVDRAAAHLQSYYLSGAYYGDRRMLKFITFAGKERTYQAWTGVPSADLHSRRTYNPCGEYTDAQGVTRYYENQTDNYSQQHYQLIYTQQAGEAWNFHAALHYTRGQGFYEDYKADAKLGRYLLSATDPSVSKADLVRQKWLDNDFYGATFSVNYSKQRLKAALGGAVNYYDGRHFGRVTWADSVPVPLLHEFYRNTAAKYDASAYAKASVRLWAGLSAYADMQFRYIDYRLGSKDGSQKDDSQNQLWTHRTYPFFNPKAGLAYALNARSELFASFALAHREPARDNFTEAGAGEEPTYETLYDYELGYALRTGRFTLAATAYFMQYRNQLIRNGKISEIGEALTANIPRSYRTGIELQAGVRITDLLRWDGNAAFSQNKILDFTEYVDDWDNGGQQEFHLGTTDIAFSPNVVANSIFAFGYRGFSAGFRSAYVGRQYIDNTTSALRALDAYFVNGIQAGYRFEAGWAVIALNVQCNNLFNHQYETNAWVYSYFYEGGYRQDDGYFPQAGRSFMARLTIAFN